MLATQLSHCGRQQAPNGVHVHRDGALGFDDLPPVVFGELIHDRRVLD